jgi:hypothetical protein
MVSQEISLRPYGYDAIHECHTNTRMPDDAHSGIRDPFADGGWVALTRALLITLLPHCLVA